MFKNKKFLFSFIAIIFVAVAASIYFVVDHRLTAFRMMNDGVVALKTENYAKAVELLSPLAESGNVEARNLLGIAYAQEFSVTQDRKRTQQLLQATYGDDAVNWFYTIATWFETGDNLAESHRDAIVWYTLAAEHGHKKAQSRLAAAYRQGLLGLELDSAKAAYWEKKAANSN